MTATLTVFTELSVTTINCRHTFTDIRCPNCQRKVMAVPGNPQVEIRTVNSDAERSGRGRVVGCKRCSSLAEVVEHG